jgi:uncharacterized phage-associated protein
VQGTFSSIDHLQAWLHALQPTQTFDATKLSQSDLMALDQVMATYGKMGFGELKAVTHAMYTYKKAWNEKTTGVNAADMHFEEFFDDDSDAVALNLGCS